IQRSGGLEGLIWEWSALDVRWGSGWGMAGVHGLGLTGAASTPGALALFVSQLPWVTTATLIPLLALRGRAPTVVAALGGLLVSALLYPLAGNWIWGGGWLANLGHNLGLGHGFVDFAAGGLVHLLGASVAWAGILSFLPRRPRRDSKEPTPLPPVHLPLLATLGVFLLLIGTLAWSWANPLLDWAVLDPARLVVNLLLAAAGGAFLPLAYTWFVANRPDPLMAARGLAAGLVAVSGSVAFVPPWTALAIGGAVGLLTPLVCYLVDHVLRWDDPTATVTVHGLGALLGLLAVGIFSDGTYGAGWNSVGIGEYLHVSGQGVSGLLAGAGYQPDWPGQLQSQAVGVAAIALFPFAVASLAFGPLAGLTHLVRKRSQSALAAAASESEDPDQGDASGQHEALAEPQGLESAEPASAMTMAETDEPGWGDTPAILEESAEPQSLSGPADDHRANGEEPDLWDEIEASDVPSDPEEREDSS
ncbi:MAG TPA: hypothetical protein VM537_04770, partial [Anaerolineae bacterium]|nr:hypothetical protein [Anaerolineae bacterium]